jgi:hypothetical protein
MIERQTIDGRDATISYFDDQFQPVDDLSKPYNAKILFDDGEMLMLSSPGNGPLKIHGHELAHWARNIAAQDAERIHTALSVGLTAGDDNTDIAHRVIGSRRLNGVNGMTEITRQHILSLGKGLLHKRKSRMSGT